MSYIRIQLCEEFGELGIDLNICIVVLNLALQNSCLGRK